MDDLYDDLKAQKEKIKGDEGMHQLHSSVKEAKVNIAEWTASSTSLAEVAERGSEELKLKFQIHLEGRKEKQKEEVKK